MFTLSRLDPTGAKKAWEIQHKLKRWPKILHVASDSDGIFSLLKVRMAFSTLTEGHFLTFCSIVSNRCAFVVHVPQLRHYTPEAKVSLGELAWVLATEQVLAKTNSDVQELAVAIQGAINIDRIMLGKLDASRKPLENLTQRTGGIKDDVLYPFFDWPTNRVVGPEHRKQ